MYKKIATFAGASAILLAAAVPAFASYGGGYYGGGSLDLAIVRNGAVAAANTGGNTQGNVAVVSGGDDTTVGGNNTLNTGDATANATAAVIANSHVSRGEDCDCVNPRHHKDIARVDNGALAAADTGDNLQGNLASVDGYDDPDDTEVTGNNYMQTGTASSRAKAFVLVNTHLSL